MIRIAIKKETNDPPQFKRSDKDLLSIGRADTNDVVLDDFSVSKNHARITRQIDRYFVTDLASTNGVFINDRRVPVRTDVRFHPRDAIKIGVFELSVDHNGPARREGPSSGAQPRADRQAPLDAGADEDKARYYRNPRIIELKSAVHKRLLDVLDLRRLDLKKVNDSQLRRQCDEIVRQIFKEMRREIQGTVDHEELIKDILDEALGLGPLEGLIADPGVSEIMVNSKDRIYVERGGRLVLTPKIFSSDLSLLGVISRIVGPLGRRIDESSPMVDARLKDGSRVNVVIPPLALNGPSVTIRKFPESPLKVEDMVRFDTLTQSMADFIKTCVVYRKNIMISGGTGSGKTTTLNILSSNIPPGERIVTIEDAAELQLPQEHLVRLESRPPNIEGKGEITIRQLVRNALRMRPDRIIVGECRGGESLDMLQAMNTGHDGSLTTAHANSPRDMLSRLETMVMMAGEELPSRAIREQIASAIDFIVQQTRFTCGSRKITYISEVVGMEGDQIVLQDIFYFKQEGIDASGKTRGVFMATGWIPEFFEDLQKRGYEVDMGIFHN